MCVSPEKNKKQNPNWPILTSGNFTIRAPVLENSRAFHSKIPPLQLLKLHDNRTHCRPPARAWPSNPRSLIAHCHFNNIALQPLHSRRSFHWNYGAETQQKNIIKLQMWKSFEAWTVAKWKVQDVTWRLKRAPVSKKQVNVLFSLLNLSPLTFPLHWQKDQMALSRWHRYRVLITKN